MSNKDLFGNPISLSMREVERFITDAANESFQNGYKVGYTTGYEECRRELNKWISVSDKLPGHREIVAVWDGKGDINIAWRKDDKWFMFNSCCSYESQLNGVTHWHELADIPEEAPVG